MENVKYPGFQLALSARTEVEFYKKVTALQHYVINHPHIPIEDIIYSVNLRHQHDKFRVTFYATNHAELIKALQECLQASPCKKGNATPQVAFLFTGQGVQYPGMTQQLYESEATFKSTIDKCAEIVDPWLKISLHDLLFNLTYSELQQTRHAHPALFAVELGLAQTLHHYGIHPNAMIGQSVGEYVAAVYAESLQLEDALRLLYEGAELLHNAKIDGRMLALKQSERVTIDLIEQYHKIEPNAVLEIALVNSATQTVVAGSFQDIGGFYGWLEEQNIACMFLSVPHAFHSSLMKPILNDYNKVTASIKYQDPKIPIISNINGQPLAKGQLNSTYWCDQLHQTVRFYDGLQWLAQNDISIFLEIGPHPVLISTARNSFSNLEAKWLATLHHRHEEWDHLLNTLTELYLEGVDVNWAVFARANGNMRHPVPLSW